MCPKPHKFGVANAVPPRRGAKVGDYEINITTVHRPPGERTLWYRPAARVPGRAISTTVVVAAPFSPGLVAIKVGRLPWDRTKMKGGENNGKGDRERMGRNEQTDFSPSNLVWYQTIAPSLSSTVEPSSPCSELPLLSFPLRDSYVSRRPAIQFSEMVTRPRKSFVRPTIPTNPSLTLNTCVFVKTPLAVAL